MGSDGMPARSGNRVVLGFLAGRMPITALVAILVTALLPLGVQAQDGAWDASDRLRQAGLGIEGVRPGEASPAPGKEPVQELPVRRSATDRAPDGTGEAPSGPGRLHAAGAALPGGGSDRPPGLGRGEPGVRGSDEPSREVTTTCVSATQRPRGSTGLASASGLGCSVASIPTWPPASTTWRCCTRTGFYTPRPRPTTEPPSKFARRAGRELPEHDRHVGALRAPAAQALPSGRRGTARGTCPGIPDRTRGFDQGDCGPWAARVWRLDPAGLPVGAFGAEVLRRGPESPSTKGSVLLQVDVDTEGRARNIRVSAPRTRAGRAGRRGVRQWQFRPARMRGERVPTRVRLEIAFRLM